MDLVVACYDVAKRFPASERFGLAEQLRRAAVSVPANIAEGYGRVHRREYVHHLAIANGSLKEAETHVLIALRLRYVRREETAVVEALSDRVGRLLSRLMSMLSQPDR